MSEPPELTEEEVRALEAELDRISVDDVLLQTVVSLLNLGARKAGLAAPPGQGPAPDLEQLRLAIEGVRALLPLVEPRHREQLAPVRETVSRLQMVYARAAGPAAPGAAAEPAPQAAPGGPRAEDPGPAQQSGRLWIPGR